MHEEDFTAEIEKSLDKMVNDEWKRNKIKSNLHQIYQVIEIAETEDIASTTVRTLIKVYCTVPLSLSEPVNANKSSPYN